MERINYVDILEAYLNKVSVSLQIRLRTRLTMTPVKVAKTLYLAVFFLAVNIFVQSGGVFEAKATPLPNVSVSLDVDRTLFPYPDELKPQVDFWIKIFAQYSTTQAVIHDNKYMNIIYAVVDQPACGGRVKGRRPATSEDVEKYKAILRKLDGVQPDGVASLTGEEAEIYRMFGDVPGEHKFLQAVERVRAQTGQKDRFREALARSTMYLEDMEKVFADLGLPRELARLPFVESAFNIQARSRDGATGLWQFMAGTGKQFMHIGRVSDDRKNFLKSTEAAARMLAYNYKVLGSWPLALTAYNHGLNGVMRAVSRTGSTDIEKITKEYKGPNFGFASRNFYTEFLAVLEILKSGNDYVGDVQFRERERTDVFRLSKAVTMDALAKNVSIVGKDDLIRLNPELTQPVMKSRVALPKGYGLRLPEGVKDEFETQFANVPAARLLASAKANRHKHLHRHKPSGKKRHYVKKARQHAFS